MRAFARNSQGISYGEELSFITLTPAVSLDLENLPDFGLVPLGTTSQEGSYSISGENLLMSIWLVVDENSGFAMSLTSAREPREFVNALELVPVDGSLPETTIHVVFCPSDTGFVEAAINGQSAGLSEPISIYLSGTGVRPPTVVNGIAFDITQTSATGSGLVIDNGLAPISSMGICWGTDPDPDLSGNIVSMDYEQGWYYCEMQDLEPNTQYYYRAFATNLAGTAYSTGEMFNTSFTPYIAFDESDYHAFGLLEVGATTEADTLHISGIGLGASVTVQAPEGFEISSTLEPLDRNFSSSVTLYPTTGTLEETPLYVRFSPDTAGPHSGYLSASSAGVDSQDLLLMGTGITLAEISTKPISEITSTSAVSGGIITFSGWCPSIAKGICWSIAPNPSLADYFTIDDEDPDFSSYLTGLQSNTTYYVRSYVTNQVGTAYGNNISFTTHVFALSIPQNVRLELDQNQIQLRWDPVENAVSYLVYRSSDPTAEDWGLPIAYTSETLWIDVDSSSKYFYRVVASTQLPSR